MIRLFIICLSLAVLALPVRAQEVQVRSGEHDSFTRLTLTLPVRMNWTIEPNSTGAAISFEDGALSVNPRFVFERVPRDRLQDVTWDATDRKLQLRFDCRCEVEGFWHTGPMLVLDLVDRPDLEKPDLVEKKTERLEKEVAVDQEQPKAVITRSLPSSTRSADLLAVEIPPIQSNETEEVLQADPPSGNLSEARNRLLKQFGRAASQGLITPREMLPDPVDSPEVATVKIEEPVAEPPKEFEDLPHQINLRAQSSIDHDFVDTLPDQIHSGSAQGCLPNHRVNVANWGTEASFGDQVSDLRLRLTGEFDGINQDVAENLIRLYLYFGFGAEAHDVITMLPESTRDVEVLSQLADIAEYGFAPDNQLLANQLDCDTAAALWSALSYKELPRDLPMDSDAVLRAFSSLPLHLRTYYGPILSRRFLDSGRIDVATTLMRVLERREELKSPEMNMAKADAAKMAGADEIADNRLEDVVNSSTQSSAEALITLIEDRVQRGEAVSFEQAQLAGAYAFENQNEPIAPALKAAHVRALAASQAFDLAFSTFAEVESELEEDMTEKLASDLYRLLGKYADDVTYLHHAMAAKTEKIEKLESPISNSAARRLLDLGFPEAAARYVSRNLEKDPKATRHRQLIRAEISIMQNKPRQAIVDLLNIEGPDVNLLRAHALSAVGDHAAAFHLFKSAEQADKAREEAWLQGDWANAVVPDVPAYNALVQMRSGQPAKTAEGDEGQTELARKRSLLRESEMARNTFSALLDANPMPTDN